MKVILGAFLLFGILTDPSLALANDCSYDKNLQVISKSQSSIAIGLKKIVVLIRPEFSGWNLEDHKKLFENIKCHLEAHLVKNNTAAQIIYLTKGYDKTLKDYDTSGTLFLLVRTMDTPAVAFSNVNADKMHRTLTINFYRKDVNNIQNIYQHCIEFYIANKSEKLKNGPIDKALGLCVHRIFNGERSALGLPDQTIENLLVN